MVVKQEPLSAEEERVNNFKTNTQMFLTQMQLMVTDCKKTMLGLEGVQWSEGLSKSMKDTLIPKLGRGVRLIEAILTDGGADKSQQNIIKLMKFQDACFKEFNDCMIAAERFGVKVNGGSVKRRRGGR